MNPCVTIEFLYAKNRWFMAHHNHLFDFPDQLMEQMKKGFQAAKSKGKQEYFNSILLVL